MIPVVSAIIGLLFIVFGCNSFQVVDTGYRGVKLRFGEIQGEPLPEGLYFSNPITDKIKELSVREEQLTLETDCFTRDTQHAKVKFTVTYFPDPAKIHLIFKQFGEDYDAKIIAPMVVGSLKDTIGKYIADDLVGKRDEARVAAFNEIKQALANRNIFVTRLDLTGLDFDPNYKQAVENKVIAIQRASEAKNKTIQIEEESKQVIVSAQAEAESMKIRSSALSQNKSLVEYEAVQKWNGQLPMTMMGNSTPFINLKGN